jgi:hypothetical protein
MRFHLDYIPQSVDFKIKHNDKIFLIGSCFSENIGTLLSEHKFKTASNPSGILFNPGSIHDCLRNLLTHSAFNEKYLVKRDDIYFSYLHHSSIHHHDKQKLIERVNDTEQKAATFLKTANYLIITFGSAYVYQHTELNEIVANCHKQDKSCFEKKLLDVDEIVKTYSTLIEALKLINPKINIIFTVSPVKYLKDGLIENTLSKSTLILAVHRLIKQHSHCHYFPAFELVNDDLRDYRFYKEDLAHPNDLAINYIWRKFSDCFFEPQTNFINQQINKLNLALSHREMISSPAESAKLKEFISRQKEEIKKLNPEIEF